MNIFNVLPQQFFSVFAGVNRELYAETIKLIYDKTQSDVSFSLSRDELIEDLIDLMEDPHYSFDSEGDSDTTSKDKANVIVRRLKETGWIQEGLNIDYSRIVFFSNVALPFVHAIDEIYENTKSKVVFEERDTQVEYSYLTPVEITGYAYTIYSLLKHNATVPKSTILLQVTENTKRMIESLKQLNYRIKSYSDSVKVLSNIDIAIKEFFTEYTQEVLQKNYHKIKTLDHISKYRNPIVDSLSTKLRSDSYIKEVSEQFVENDFAETKSEAKKMVKDMILYTIDSMQNIDNIVSQIEAENYMYTNIILKKTKFMLENLDDVEGNIKLILKGLSEYASQNIELDVGDLIGLYQAGYIDNESLYTPRKSTKPFKQKRLQIEDQINTENELLLDKIRHSQHSIKSIQNYVQEVLNGREVIELEDIPLNSIDDFIHLIYIVIYSTKSKIYDVEYDDEDVVVRGVRFKKLRVRGKSYVAGRV